MGDSLKILGQAAPVANILTPIYTVPALIQATISSIVICNQSSAATNFYISIAQGGAVDDPKQYIYYNLFLDGLDTFITTIGISLSSTDEIRVQSTNNVTSFNIFGLEL